MSSILLSVPHKTNPYTDCLHTVQEEGERDPGTAGRTATAVPVAITKQEKTIGLGQYVAHQHFSSIPVHDQKTETTTDGIRI